MIPRSSAKGRLTRPLRDNGRIRAAGRIVGATRRRAIKLLAASAIAPAAGVVTRWHAMRELTVPARSGVSRMRAREERWNTYVAGRLVSASNRDEGRSRHGGRAALQHEWKRSRRSSTILRALKAGDGAKAIPLPRRAFETTARRLIFCAWARRLAQLPTPAISILNARSSKAR